MKVYYCSDGRVYKIVIMYSHIFRFQKQKHLIKICITTVYNIVSRKPKTNTRIQNERLLYKSIEMILHVFIFNILIYI